MKPVNQYLLYLAAGSNNLTLRQQDMSKKNGGQIARILATGNNQDAELVMEYADL